MVERLKKNFGDVFHLNAGVFRRQTVAQHDHAEGAGDGERGGAGDGDFLDA